MCKVINMCVQPITSMRSIQELHIYWSALWSSSSSSLSKTISNFYSLCAVFVFLSSDLSQHVVTDCKQAIDLLQEGIANRITAATHNHDASSRSHAIFTIQYTQVISHWPPSSSKQIDTSRLIPSGFCRFSSLPVLFSFVLFSPSGNPGEQPAFRNCQQDTPGGLGRKVRLETWTKNNLPPQPSHWTCWQKCPLVDHCCGPVTFCFFPSPFKILVL